MQMPNPTGHYSRTEAIDFDFFDRQTREAIETLAAPFVALLRLMRRHKSIPADDEISADKSNAGYRYAESGNIFGAKESTPKTQSINYPSSSLPDGGLIFVRHPTEEELSSLYRLSEREAGAEVAPLELVLAVYRHNPDTFLGVYYAPLGSLPENGNLIGYYSFLHLNADGERALATGTFDALNPQMPQLTRAGERPVIIYVWALVARRVARLATPLVARALGRDLYGGVPIYAKAGALGGLNTLKHYGFARARESGLSDFFRLDSESFRSGGETPQYMRN